MKQLLVIGSLLVFSLNSCVMSRIYNDKVQTLELWKYTEAIVFVKTPMYGESTIVNVSIKLKDKKLKKKETGNIFIIELNEKSENKEMKEVLYLQKDVEGISVYHTEHARIIHQIDSFQMYKINYHIINPKQ